MAREPPPAPAIIPSTQTPASPKYERLGSARSRSLDPVTFAAVRKFALALEGTEEETSNRTPAFKVRGRLYARLREDSESLVVLTDFDTRDQLMAGEPDVFFITDHYLRYPWVLVRLSNTKLPGLRKVLHRAWELASAGPRRPRRQ